MIKGQRVHSTLYGGRDGVIAAIQGIPSPETCRPSMGFGVTGGKATCDICWDNGQRSAGIPESLIRCSTQWKLLDEFWSDEQVQAAEAFCQSELERRTVEAERKEAALVAETEQLKKDYPALLTKEDEPMDITRAATNIRKLLKANWPKTKFSVRKGSSGGSIDVRWEDGPTPHQVDSLVSRFEAGHFNGMEDIYEYRDSAWTRAFGSVQYLFTQRSSSDESVMHCVDILWQVLPGNLESVAKPTRAEEATSSYTPVPSLSASVAEFLRTLLCHYDASAKTFIPSAKPSRTSFVVSYAVALNPTAAV